MLCLGAGPSIEAQCVEPKAWSCVSLKLFVIIGYFIASGGPPGTPAGEAETSAEEITSYSFSQLTILYWSYDVNTQAIEFLQWELLY